jgi:hypothetical protein
VIGSTDGGPTSLARSQAPVFCGRLRTALRALRLNLYFPAWRAVADHLAGVAHLPPGQDRLALCTRTGWPHPQEWLRFRIDHKLAPGLIEHVSRAAESGDVPSAKKALYFNTLRDLSPLFEPAVQVDLVHVEEGPDGRQGRFEITVDRWELAEPSFIRWTVRVLDLDIGDRIAVHELEARATAAFERRMLVLAAQPALAAWQVLWDDAEVRVEELVRGEIGPVLHHPSGPRLSATMTRIANHLTSVRIDDPLAPDLLVPDVDEGRRFGMSHSRKWAVPAGEAKAYREWLVSLGSKNIVYAFDF